MTTRTVQKDFLRAGLAHEEIVTDEQGQPVMIGKGRWRRPKVRITSEDADGKVIDLHAMRATLGTALVRAGVAPQIAQRIMRHSDYRTTQKHYTVLGLADTSKAIDQLPTVGITAQQAATGTCDVPRAGETSSAAQQCPHLNPRQLQRETVRNGSKPCVNGSIGPCKSSGTKTLQNKGKSGQMRPETKGYKKAGEGIRTLDVQLGNC